MLYYQWVDKRGSERFGKDYLDILMVYSMIRRLPINELPCLSTLIPETHSILPTRVGTERHFSIARLTLADRRTYSDPEQLNNILYVLTVAKMNSQI